MTLTEIAAAIGLSKSSTHQAMVVLESKGWVHRLADQRYTIGIRAWQVGCVALPLEMAGTAGPYMVDLVQKVVDGAALAVLDGDETVCIQLVESARAVRVHDKIGNRCPAYCVSNGINLLADKSEVELDLLLPDTLMTPTLRSPFDRAALREHLDRARASGFAVLHGAWRDGVSGISVPVHGPDGRVSAALSVALPDFHATSNRLAEILVELRATAARIEDAFGYQAPADAPQQDPAARPEAAPAAVASAAELAAIAGAGQNLRPFEVRKRHQQKESTS